MNNPISMPDGTVDSVVKGSQCHHGVAGGFEHDGHHYILMAESTPALLDIMKHVFPEFEPLVEKQVEVVLMKRNDVFLKGDEL